MPLVFPFQVGASFCIVARAVESIAVDEYHSTVGLPVICRYFPSSAPRLAAVPDFQMPIVIVYELGVYEVSIGARVGVAATVAERPISFALASTAETA